MEQCAAGRYFVPQTNTILERVCRLAALGSGAPSGETHVHVKNPISFDSVWRPRLPLRTHCPFAPIPQS